ncbi:MAG TPA: response regulator transcription factor [Candidatus Limnocylindrales bacterium]|nr:response regulator transcription factor [Candidatus Limnocylindrales bacterium]
MQILVIEDDAKIAQAVRQGLSAEGFEISVARTGDEGLARLDEQGFDLVVLDWMLPGQDGISVLRNMRERGVATPVLLVTARDAVEDRVLGLDSGADDYLVKPFAFAELLARIRALLRRRAHEEPSTHKIADLTVDVQARRVTRGEQEILLTPREYDLLVYLLRHQPQVVTRRMLAAEVWREPNRATPLDNVIDVHVAHLRKKIDDGHSRKLIHTVRGVGFVVRAGDE